MSVYSIELHTPQGQPTTLDAYRGQVLLAVNVASKCGFTPQYAGLQKLHDAYAARGFSVLAFPCNQFLFQEPGGPEAVAACGAQYGVSFPVFAKLRVRGRQQHQLYSLLTKQPDNYGKAGFVRWNFEKVLIGRDGAPVARFRSKVTPDDPRLIAAIESALSRPAPEDEPPAVPA